MLEVTIDKLPGGDASRRICLACITLTNTGDGGDGARTYAVRLTHADERARAEISADSCRTYRERDEQVLRLVQRAIGKLLGDRDS